MNRKKIVNRVQESGAYISTSLKKLGVVVRYDSKGVMIISIR